MTEQNNDTPVELSEDQEAVVRELLMQGALAERRNLIASLEPHRGKQLEVDGLIDALEKAIEDQTPKPAEGE